MKKEREKELKKIMEGSLIEIDYFDYFNWDALIQCSESMTETELEWMLDWMADHYTIKTTLERKKRGSWE